MRDLFRAQIPNLFLYAPFVIAAGVGLFMTWPTDPHIYFPGLICVVAIALVFMRRMQVSVRGILLAVFGFCYAAFFTDVINTPVINRNLHDVEIVGRVTNIDYTDGKTRIYIRTDASALNDKLSGDANIRVSINSDATTPNIGDMVRMHGGLYAPGGADAPSAFDFARWAYFNNLTATGYADDIDVLSHTTHHGVNGVRDHVHRRADSFLADALVLGYKNVLPTAAADVWRTNGVAHVWAISGFHMTLVGGWIFIIFFALFRCVPYVTRRVPARIPATVVACVGLGIYLFVSGMGATTLRAFLMTVLVALALVLGRAAINMRNVSIVFIVLILINPYFVMSAGFQLSFAAIYGLVWFWGTVNPKLPHNKILKYLYASTMTAVIATVFTTPFVALHFNSLPIYGLVGNLVLLPIFSFLIMPIAMIGTLCAMVGFHLPLDIASHIYDFALHVATAIANMPAANIVLPNISNVAIILICIGFICIMFIRNVRLPINYIFGAACIVMGVCVAALSPRPIFFATPDNELIGFMRDDELVFNKSRASNHFFAFDTWRKMRGIAPATTNTRIKPTDGMWRYDTEKFTLVYIQKFVPLSKNIVHLCRDTDIDYIVSYFAVHAPACHAKILSGGFVIYKSGRVKYVAHRRWHSRRG